MPRVEPQHRPLSADVAAMAFVQSAVLLQGLDQEWLARLLDAGELADYPAGGRVFSAGEGDDHLYLIVDGGVTITKLSPAAREPRVVAELDRQAVFGEGAVLTERARSSTAIARVPTRLVRLPGAVVRAAAEASPKLGRRLAALMAGRAKDSEKKLGPAG